MNRKEILKQIKKDVKSFLSIKNDLQNDRDFVLEACLVNNVVIKKDKKLVYKASQESSVAFWLSSDKLKHKRKFVLKMIKNIDEEIIYAALKKDSSNLETVPYRFKNDKNLALELLQDNAWIFQYLSFGLRNDQDIIMKINKT